MFFGCPTAQWTESRKPRKVMTLQHFLRFFQAPGGRKSTKNVSESSLEHQPRSKSALGASGDQFWNHFGSILGSKIGPKGDLKFASKKHLKKKTWLSWNGKRGRRESVQALQARRQQREQQEQPKNRDSQRALSPIALLGRYAPSPAI